MEMTREKKKISIRIMLMLEVIWGFIWLYVLKDWEFSGKDVVYYLSAIILVPVILGVLFCVLKKTRLKDWDSRILDFVLGALLLGFIVWIFFFPYIADFLSQKYFVTNRLVNHCIVAVVTAAAWGILYRWGEKFLQWKSRYPILLPVYLILSKLCVDFVYRPNVFCGDLYHFDAYWHSVYRVLQGQPYSEINTGVYGFYGILIAPFVKLAGGSFINFIALCAVLLVVCMLCFWYVLEKLVDSTVIKLVSAIAMTGFCVWGKNGIYLQVFPHRLLFISITLAYLVWTKKHHKSGRLWKALGLLIAGGSLVWNLESGIACLLVWEGAKIVDCLQEYKINSAVFGKRILFCLAECLAVFFFWWALIQGYNRLAGGALLSMKDLLFPFIGTGNDYLSFLYDNLPANLSPWMLVLLLFFICIGIVVMQTSLCGFAGKNDKVTCFAACIMGTLVLMVYYVNHSAALLLFSLLPTTCIIIACFAEFLLQKRAKGYMSINILVLSGLVFMMLTQWNFYNHEWEDEKDLQSFYAFAERVKETIPKDTLGIGEGVSEVYSYLGWDTGYYGIDRPDFPVVSEEGKNAIWEMFHSVDAVFANDQVMNSVSYLWGDNVWREEYFEENFVCYMQILYEGEDYRYYVRKE